MREPWFWRSQSMAAKVASAALTPLSALYDLAQRSRWALTQPTQSETPIICIGNATLGGVGKTPFAIALFDLLQAEGLNCHFLTRGYGGVERGPLQVDLNTHQSYDVGDEALLLANHGPVIKSANRPAGALAATMAGANAIIMDDGFQNPTINKSFSILLIDGGDPQGNGKIFPAGPLREPLSRARERADICIVIGADKKIAECAAAQFETPFAAWIEPIDAPELTKVVAFSGIGKPDKFFTLLSRCGFDVARAISFPDHHPFTEHDLSAAKKLANAEGAALITTEKDHVRLSENWKHDILAFPVRMTLNNPQRLIEIMRPMIDQARASR